MRIALFISLMFLAISAEAGKEQTPSLTEGYRAAFEGENAFHKDATFAQWESSVASLSTFVEQNHKNDALLLKQIKELLSLNKIFLNSARIMANEGHDLGKFPQVIEESKQAQNTLKKSPFFNPSKRQARDALVELAKNLESAATIAQARVSISNGIQNLATLRELDRLSGEMDDTYEKAKTIANDPDLRKQFEAQIKEDVRAAKQSLSDISKAWLSKRKASLEQLRQKQAMKIEDLTAIQGDFISTERALKETNEFLESLPLEQVPLVLTLFMLTGDPLAAANKKLEIFNKKMAKIQKEVVTMQVGMAKIDLLLNKEVDDPRFEKATFDAQNNVKIAAEKLKNIDTLFEQKRRESLSPLSIKASDLN